MTPLQLLAAVPAFLVTYVAVATLFMHATSASGASDWRSLSRAPVGLAPDPASTPEAVVQVYAARALRWRGYFGVHPWIAVKRTGAARYTVYEVNGWRLRYGGSTVVSSGRAPDGLWYGSRPELLAEARGHRVDDMIDRIEAAVHSYPFADRYHVWPGPNSNTFAAHVLRAVPELRADLPPTAVGKDYNGIRPVAKLPSGTGAQVNAYGLLGVAAGIEEGIEVNLLGLTFGLDPLSLSLKLPLIGRVGPKRLREPAGKHATSQPPVDPAGRD
jgi:uncharacterized protein DUF3750